VAIRRHIDKGTVFGSFTLLGRVPTACVGASQYALKCVCGKIVIRTSSRLLQWTPTCARCPSNPRADSSGTKTPEYRAWQHMKSRCYLPTNKKYHNYGARGIAVCDRWRDSFENFLEDVGQRPSPRHSLDRRDNNGNYEPANCWWATAKQQANNMRANHLITFNGVTKTLMQWSEETGLRPTTLFERINRGWSTSDALTMPVRGRTN